MILKDFGYSDDYYLDIKRDRNICNKCAEIDKNNVLKRITVSCPKSKENKTICYYCSDKELINQDYMKYFEKRFVPNNCVFLFEYQVLKK